LKLLPVGDDGLLLDIEFLDDGLLEGLSDGGEARVEAWVQEGLVGQEDLSSTEILAGLADEPEPQNAEQLQEPQMNLLFVWIVVLLEAKDMKLMFDEEYDLTIHFKLDFEECREQDLLVEWVCTL
jgi:hypothetical protein